MSCGSEKADRRKIEFIHHCVGRGGIRKHELCHTSRRPDEIPSEAADSLAILASTAGARHRTRPAPLPPRSKASKLRFHNNRHSRQRSRVHSLALACTSFLRHRPRRRRHLSRWRSSPRPSRRSASWRRSLRALRRSPSTRPSRRRVSCLIRPVRTA